MGTHALHVLTLGAVVAASAVFGFLYAVRTPMFQAPDEPSHFAVIEHVASTGGFPVASAKHPEMYESLQPPLYYYVLAPVDLALRPFPKPSRVVGLRLATMAMGLALLPLLYKLARGVLPRGPAGHWTALCATAAAGLLPQRLAMYSAIDNDVVGEAGVLAVALVVIRRLSRAEVSQRDDVVLGILGGLALLGKLTTALPVGILVLGAVAGSARRRRDSWPRFLRSLAIVGGVALAVNAPWLVRTLHAYGDLTGYHRHHELGLAAKMPRWHDTPNPLRNFTKTSFESFWVTLGWMQYSAAPRVYQYLRYISSLSAAGLLGYVATAALQRRTQRCALELLLLLGVVVASIAWLVWFSVTQFYQPQGRYLFVGMPGIAILFALGLCFWGRSRFVYVVTALVFAFLVALNGYVQFRLVSNMTPFPPRPTGVAYGYSHLGDRSSPQRGGERRAASPGAARRDGTPRFV